MEETILYGIGMCFTLKLENGISAKKGLLDPHMYPDLSEADRESIESGTRKNLCRFFWMVVLYRESIHYIFLLRHNYSEISRKMEGYSN